MTPAGQELVDVGLVAGVPEDASWGESKTRCRARVSSTAPRLEPRCPPVLVTVSTMKARISMASSAELLVAERPQVGGGLDAGQDHPGAWSPGERAKGQATRRPGAARCLPHGSSRLPAGAPSETEPEPAAGRQAAEDPDEGRRPGGASQPGADPATPSRPAPTERRAQARQMREAPTRGRCRSPPRTRGRPRPAT